MIVATPTNIQTQLLLASKGGVDRIVCSGNFTRITVYNLNPPSPVIIDFGDRNGVHCKVGNMPFSNSSNWIVQGGEHTGAVYGQITIDQSHHITVQDADFHNWGTCALSAQKSHNLIFQRNRFHSSHGDCMDIVASQLIQVLNNSASDINYTTTLHSDFVQMWNLAGYPLTSDIDVFDNTMIAMAQFCGMYSTSTAQPPGMTRVRVRRNIIASGLTWASSLCNAKECEVTDNFAATLYGETPGWQPPTWVVTDGPTAATPDSGTSGNINLRNTNGIAIPK